MFRPLRFAALLGILALGVAGLTAAVHAPTIDEPAASSVSPDAGR